MNLGPVGAHLLGTRMADDYDPPSASLDPQASVARSVVEVPDACTDEDLDWLRERACGLTVERETPRVDVTPAPRLGRTIRC